MGEGIGGKWLVGYCMTYLTRGVVCLGLGLLCTAVAWASEVDGCAGPFQGGRQPTSEALAHVLTAHTTWLHTPQHPQAQRANLCGADLRGARLSGANLAHSDLHGAILTRALLSRTNFRQADLRRSNLQQAILGEADLQGANLQRANLSGAYLVDANLQQSNLFATDLREATLLGTDLRQAQLGSADLRRAMATRANLGRTTLAGADLREANLSGVNLGEASLIDARLTGASLIRSELAAVIFEPDSMALPPVANFAQAKNLSRLTFQTSPHGLFTLRELFKQAGMRQEERALTFAINRQLGQQQSPVERAVRWVFFELTCQYGMAPKRPLLIVGGLLLGGALPYAFTLHRRASGTAWTGHSWGAIWRYWAGVGFMSLCLSLVSIVRLGRPETLVERCLARVLPHSPAATLPRWGRRLAALLSFCSIYLLALWALIGIGQPFE